MLNQRSDKLELIRIAEAVAAEKNAAINIFPSNPISNIPALSLNRPARLQNSKGTASLRAESRT